MDSHALELSADKGGRGGGKIGEHTLHSHAQPDGEGSQPRVRTSQERRRFWEWPRSEVDGFAEGLHLYWHWEADDIEDGIVFQIKKWHNSVAQSLESSGESKAIKSDWLPYVTVLHGHGAQEGRMKEEIKGKDGTQNPAVGQSKSPDLLPDGRG